jgi:hypothetical protein
MLIEALQNVLAADTGMQAYLGTPLTRADKANGIWPVQAPDQPTMPYLVMRQVTGSPLQESLQGTGCLTTERWRFTCAGSTYRSAKKFAKYLRKLLIASDGPLNGDQTVGCCFVQGVWAKLEVDDSVSLGKGTMFSVHLDVDVNYQDFDARVS